MKPEDMIGAEISDDGQYRYLLWRRWRLSDPQLLWVMLNPSTADARKDDPTLRRCAGFARAWGYGGFEIVNLWAYRTSSPVVLRDCCDLYKVDESNNMTIATRADDADLVIAAWGSASALPRDALQGRAEDVCTLVGRPMHCLARNNDGHPTHPLYPLYVETHATPTPWVPNWEKKELSKAGELHALLAGCSFQKTSEAVLQSRIADRLHAASLPFEREVSLTESDRIDFMVDRVGIEVKVHGSRSALIRQLHRYAQSDLVDELLVVTTVPRLAGLPTTFNGKTITALVLSSCLI